MADTAIIKTFFHISIRGGNQKRTDYLITSLPNRETLIWRVPLIVQLFVMLVTVIFVVMTKFLRCVPIVLASPGSIN